MGTSRTRSRPHDTRWSTSRTRPLPRRTRWWYMSYKASSATYMMISTTYTMRYIRYLILPAWCTMGIRVVHDSFRRLHEGFREAPDFGRKLQGQVCKVNCWVKVFSYLRFKHPCLVDRSSQTISRRRGSIIVTKTQSEKRSRDIPTHCSYFHNT